jgi:transposase-like protein
MTVIKPWVSDASRQYHPVAFMFMSHWTQENFKHFFKTLMDILSKFNMRLDIKTLVQDHDSGCLNEIKSIFPESLIVMCFFHVIMNIKKQKHLIPTEYYNEILDDIREIHNSTSETMKNKRTKKFNNKLDKINAPEFKKYYNKVWVDGAFKHWHIYNTSPGFSTTNNPVESYNAVIKKFFTNRFGSLS